MPDLHWHIGEGAEQETIAKTTSSRRSRRSWIALLLVVILGVGLGTWYRSLPEPAPRPTPLPSPTRRLTPQPSPTLRLTPIPPGMPVKLYAAIDREALALTDGDYGSFQALQMSQPNEVTAWDYNILPAWERPSDGKPLYKIISYTLRTPIKAWAEIGQFRRGRWFRQTRFYQFNAEENRWLRSEPDPFFWNGKQEQRETQHFILNYAMEDRDWIDPAAQRLEQDYQALCRDLGCASTSGEPKIEVTLRGNEGPMIAGRGYFVPAGKENFELRFPSPRVTGIYETGRLADPNSSGLYLLAHILAKRVAQSDDFSDYSSSNEIIFSAIQEWALARIDTQFDYFSTPVGNWGQGPELPLEQLWDLPHDARFSQAYLQAQLLIYFIEQEYGTQSMPKLLKALGSAESFADLIETGLGVPFPEFDQKWQAWINQNTGALH